MSSNNQQIDRSKTQKQTSPKTKTTQSTSFQDQNGTIYCNLLYTGLNFLLSAEDPSRSQSKLTDDANIKIIVPDLKLKGQDEWISSDSCQVCLRPITKMTLKEHHCRVCGKTICADCSRKKVNEQRACDLCFLKQKLRGQQNRKKDQLRNKDEMIKKLKIQAQETEALALKVECDARQLEQDINNEKEINENQVKEIEQQMKRLGEQIRIKNENNERQKETINVDKQYIREKEKEIETLKTKIQNLKIDIAGKQKNLANKQEELKVLNIQKQNQILSVNIKFQIYDKNTFAQMQQMDKINQQQKYLEDSQISQQPSEKFSSDQKYLEESEISQQPQVLQLESEKQSMVNDTTTQTQPAIQKIETSPSPPATEVIQVKKGLRFKQQKEHHLSQEEEIQLQNVQTNKQQKKECIIM